MGQTNRVTGGEVVGKHNFVGVPSSYLIPKDQLAKLDEVLEEIRSRAGTQAEYHLDPVFAKGDTRYLEEGTFPVWDCKEPWSRAYMTPTGDFMPCPMFPGYSMGNIRNNSFLEIWNSRQARICESGSARVSRRYPGNAASCAPGLRAL